MMTENPNLDIFKYMWTTHLEQFILVRHVNSYGIVRIFPSGTISSLIVENDEVYRKIQQKLLEAGAMVMGYDEFMEFKHNRP